MLSIGIIGGTGYTGKYLLEYCNNHPFVDEYKIYGNESAGENLYSIFPSFQGVIENDLVESINDLSYEHDLYFVALPHGKSLEIIPALHYAGKFIIDLGGDYRLDNDELYKLWYGIKHNSSELLTQKIYGLADFTSLYSDKLLIANPGCYPTAALLSLLPIVKKYSNNINTVSVNAYSGTSGAGKSPKTHLLMSEMDGNVKAYNVNNHRHEPEILQELGKYGFDSSFSFTTHLLPVARGIYCTSAVHCNIEIDETEVMQVFENEYADSKFIRLRKEPPSLNWVTETNFCDINVSVCNNKIIVTTAIDNLIKGASGQAIQNMNKLYGWDESLGIINKQIKNLVS